MSRDKTLSRPLVRAARMALAGGLALAMAGCSSSDESGPFPDVLAALKATLGPKAPPPKLGPAAIAKALGATDKPVLLIQVEKSEAQSLLLEIERNGAYHTYATPQRQTITFNDGIITATKGLGGDLMSSDITQLQARLRQGSYGPVTHVMRVLNGESRIDEIVLRCTLKPGKALHVRTGVIDVQTRGVVEDCENGDHDVTNSYFVDKSGTVLSSRQWIGPFTGHVVMQQIRP